MKPFYRLHPIFRHGSDTPWGGTKLRSLFGKDIPDDTTGEALEASTLPGQESRVDDGRTLTEVAGDPLPLLLKLLDARDILSVQVHPDDAYAAANANGRLGKTEAWYILQAEPGAKLVYGLTPETDLRTLPEGQEIEQHLRWVEARAGDVFYIPAGMVHAIGPGIVLYEIQQTSDVTYRLWDWDRKDVAGNTRELHWKHACAVANTSLQMQPTQGETVAYTGGKITRFLGNEHFSLARYDVQSRLKLRRHLGFQYVTALGALRLVCGEDSLALSPGETAFVPGGVSGITIEGEGSLLVSGEGYPRK